MVTVFIWCFFLAADKRKLADSVIRFHVVANSDSEADQSLKLKVRDAVLDSIQKDLQKMADLSEAKKYLQDNLPKIQTIVQNTLVSNGFSAASSVTLCKERFDIRRYDTFSLPAGVYDSLRIIIGEGKGKNWWCVAFPTLCVPATSSGFEAAAAGAGFSETMVRTLSNADGYSIRFYFLDQLGQLEKILFQE